MMKKLQPDFFKYFSVLDNLIVCILFWIVYHNIFIFKVEKNKKKEEEEKLMGLIRQGIVTDKQKSDIILPENKLLLVTKGKANFLTNLSKYLYFYDLFFKYHFKFSLPNFL